MSRERVRSTPRPPLVASGNLRRRRWVSRLATGGATVARSSRSWSGIVVFSVAQRGAGALSWDFFTKAPPLFGGPGGGIAPMIVGTGIIVGVAR